MSGTDWNPEPEAREDVPLTPESASGFESAARDEPAEATADAVEVAARKRGGGRANVVEALGRVKRVRKETRVGLAAMLSFGFVLTAFIVNRGRSPKPSDKGAVADAPEAPNSSDEKLVAIRYPNEAGGGGVADPPPVVAAVEAVSDPDAAVELPASRVNDPDPAAVVRASIDAPPSGGTDDPPQPTLPSPTAEPPKPTEPAPAPEEKPKEEPPKPLDPAPVPPTTPEPTKPAEPTPELPDLPTPAPTPKPSEPAAGDPPALPDLPKPGDSPQPPKTEAPVADDPPTLPDLPSAPAPPTTAPPVPEGGGPTPAPAGDPAKPADAPPPSVPTPGPAPAALDPPDTAVPDTTPKPAEPAKSPEPTKPPESSQTPKDPPPAQPAAPPTLAPVPVPTPAVGADRPATPETMKSPASEVLGGPDPVGQAPPAASPFPDRVDEAPVRSAPSPFDASAAAGARKLDPGPASASSPKEIVSTPKTSMKPAAPLGPGWKPLKRVVPSLMAGAVAADRLIDDKPTIPDNPMPAREPRPTEEIEPVLHTVQRGENFWTISRLYYGSGRYYKALWSSNRAKVPNIRELYIGTTIKVPPPELLDRSLIEAPTRPEEPDGGRIDRTPSRSSSTTEGAPLPRVRRTNETEADLSIPPRGPAKIREEIDPPSRPTYRVRTDDTLRSIARDVLGDSRRDRELLELNRALISDPRRLTPGQVLVLPSDAVIRTRIR
ncbi:MAG: LysM peptidoglycan-binding domain-containing protein [Isosphaeraceae bacterium]|nr:LysM peptidoglycan-binding domain-containing protein [Isosphaeraceae bacterium]